MGKCNTKYKNAGSPGLDKCKGVLLRSLLVTIVKTSNWCPSTHLGNTIKKGRYKVSKKQIPKAPLQNKTGDVQNQNRHLPVACS